MSGTAASGEAGPLGGTSRLGDGGAAGLIAVCGLVAGVVLRLLTDLAQNSDIGGVVNGNDWSLRGNGALVVPFAGIPAVLAAGWTALALWSGARRHWLVVGLVAGLFVLLLLGLGSTLGFGPVIFGPDRSWGAIETGIITLAFLAGLGIARGFHVLTRAGLVAGIVAWGLLVAVRLASPAGLGTLAMLLLPLVLVAPLVTASFQARGERRVRSAGWLAAAYLLLPLATLAGLAVPLLAIGA